MNQIRHLHFSNPYKASITCCGLNILPFEDFVISTKKRNYKTVLNGLVKVYPKQDIRVCPNCTNEDYVALVNLKYIDLG